MASTVHLDGRTLEGGGQIVRIALAISALTGIPIRITNIRGNRTDGGGLKNQHLAAVDFLAAACDATVTGAELKSNTLEFKPSFSSSNLAASQQQPHPDLKIKQKTVGSIALVLQAILPFLLFSCGSAPGPAGSQPDHPGLSVTVTITGGLNGSTCPSQDYIHEVLLPTLSRIGLPSIATLSARRHAHDSNEGGAVQYHITPLGPGTSLSGFRLTDRGKITHIRALIRGRSTLTARARDELRAQLKKFADASPSHFADRALAFEIQNTNSKHLYVLLVALSTNGHRLGADRQRNCVRQTEGLTHRRVALLVEEVATQLFGEIERGGCVDTHMQDQLVIFQALAKGRSVVDGGRKEPSLHTRTARWVVREMLGVKFDEGDGSCEGIGLVAGERFADRAIDGVDTELQKTSIKGG
ncbi:RNA 3'-terminal phosphate cyclase [Coniosporium apollinis CBS 100218]|uniref:RNA 3'-terminal phosphate cyclase n=1 Tax=Coniosporium apollinis (strain CBS 100218) TaxID=1168221 RepID=R7YV35_CONA1|nr:RNA 3'-terminal phosphate cyclase [Coniosporium apollinis CBS 100218]EON65703.1 RNA 3'-terminal phosphate cyclase [Coniosporium apollinis CBS 100218]